MRYEIEFMRRQYIDVTVEADSPEEALRLGAEKIDDESDWKRYDNAIVTDTKTEKNTMFPYEQSK